EGAGSARRETCRGLPTSRRRADAERSHRRLRDLGLAGVLLAEGRLQGLPDGLRRRRPRRPLQANLGAAQGPAEARADVARREAAWPRTAVHEDDLAAGSADDRAADRADPLLPPARRDPDDDDRRRLDRLDERARRALDEEGHRVDANETLHRERRVRKKAARVSLSADGISACPDERELSGRRRRQPRTELERSPI